MTLEMTLDAKDFTRSFVRGFSEHARNHWPHVRKTKRGSSETSRHRSARVDRTRLVEPGRPSKGLCRNDDIFSKRRGHWNGLLVFNETLDMQLDRFVHPPFGFLSRRSGC